MQNQVGYWPIFRQGKDIYLEAKRNFRNKVKDGDIKVSARRSRKMPMMISNSTPNKFCLNFKE